MSVKVNLHPNLLQFTGDRPWSEVKGGTVGECLDEVLKQFPRLRPGLFDKKGRLLPYVEIYINQESAYPEELAKPVRDGDELYVTLSIAGG